MKSLFVGVDVSKLWLDFAAIGGIAKEAELRVDNTKLGFRKAVQWLKRMKAQEEWLICMEHTGVYSQPLWEYLTEKGIEYCVVAGSVITSGLSIKRGKSDKLDALTIALFARRYADELKTHKIPTDLLRRLKLLFAYRDRLVKANVLMEVPTGEVKMYAQTDGGIMIQETKEVVDFLKVKIKRVEKIMLAIINSDEQTANATSLLCRYLALGSLPPRICSLSPNASVFLLQAVKWLAMAG